MPDYMYGLVRVQQQSKEVSYLLMLHQGLEQEE